MVAIGVGEAIAFGTLFIGMLGSAYKLGNVEKSKIDRDEFEKHRDTCDIHARKAQQQQATELARIHSRIDELINLQGQIVFQTVNNKIKEFTGGG